MVYRVMQAGNIRERMEARLKRCKYHTKDGPTRRIHMLKAHKVLGPYATKLLADPELDKKEWEHDMRQAWRDHLVEKASRLDRFNGCYPLNRKATMVVHDELEKLAEGHSDDEDYDYAKVNRARADLGMLRHMLAGGLLTEERKKRHKGVEEGRECRCGAPNGTIEHKAWECPEHNPQRLTLRNEIGRQAYDNMPKCLSYAGLIPENYLYGEEKAIAIQRFLIGVWTREYMAYHGEDVAIFDRTSGATRAGPQTTSAASMARGHHVVWYEDPSGHSDSKFFCRKCGKSIKYQGHIGLKITKKKCKQEDLPKAQWLERPGAVVNAIKDRMAYEKLQDYANGHVLE